MRTFEPYVADLERLTSAALQHGLAEPGLARAHLDGEAGRALRRAVSLEDLRASGAFFTGERLAAAGLGLVGTGRRSFVDPACGCGDLLLAAAWRLSVAPTVDATLKQWGEQLAGHDLDPAFVRATRARLALLALVRGAAPTAARPPLVDLLPEIRQGDGLREDLPGQVVLLNPPYGYTVAGPDRDWVRGRVARAALFSVDIVERLVPGQELVAILPDVLRSGSRYESWRRRVAACGDVRHVVPAGPFDALTDVDVFLLHCVRSNAPTSGWPATASTLAGPTVGDLFEVSVGALVAYRARGRGPWHRYLDARNAGAPGATVDPQRSRRFAGTTHRPPFVAIRRTSAPSQGGPRLRSSVVLGDRPVAVENHLLVATPYSGGEALCHRLVAHLQSVATTGWLDHRIRCRHLTVASLRELPWPDADRDHSTPSLRTTDPRPLGRGAQSAP